MDRLKARYIVVEGPIGAGKTSLARLLAERGGADLLLEDPENNPFLARFYQEPRRWALATQLFFLFQRVNQLSGLKQLDLFERIYEHLAPQAAVPDLVIYLQAPVETLMSRVRRRGAAYERGLNEDYLSRLTQAYGRFFHDYSASPLLIVNSKNLNFVDRPGDFDLLLRRITEMRGPREFFNLGT